MSRGDDRRGVEEWRAAAEIPAAEKTGPGLWRIVLGLAVIAAVAALAYFLWRLR